MNVKSPTALACTFGIAILLALGIACGAQDTKPSSEPPPDSTEPTTVSAATREPSPTTQAIETPSGAVQVGPLIQPADLVYQGAFRLPDGPEELGWGYSGAAMTHYPDGDPNGPADGYPGSIFGTGHNWNQYVSEVSIPVPVLSPVKDLNALETAVTLQDFANIRGNLFDHLDFEIPRVGLAYEPDTDKLHFCWGQHMQEGEAGPTHGWSDLDLANPQTAGAWRIGDYVNFLTNDYLFPIPQEWVDAYTPGMPLATGRFRDGGQGGKGPTLFAYGLPDKDDPPAAGTMLPAVPLLLYSDFYADDDRMLNDYHHADEWSGGAWLTAGTKSAVVFVGTKGVGECWYGFGDGTVWPDEPPYPDVPPAPNDARGWWSSSFEGQMLFYNPAELAAVVRGELEPWQPQPYATLNIDEHLYNIQSNRQYHHVGAASFDRERELLYVFEPLADEDKSLIHVWRIAD